MSRTKTKRYLVLLAAVGLVAAALGGTGTFASFNAETTNAGNTFSTGTLLLSNKVPDASAVACLSASGTDNIKSCTFVVSGSHLFPGATPTTGTLVLQNVGTLDASDLMLSTAGCTPTVVTPTSFNTGNLCDSVFMYVQEQDNVPGSPTWCWFGVGAGTSTCDPAFTGATELADGITAFNGTFGTPVNISAHSPLAGPLPASGTRYFKIGLFLKDQGTAAANNHFQGLSASFPLTWHIDS